MVLLAFLFPPTPLSYGLLHKRKSYSHKIMKKTVYYDPKPTGDKAILCIYFNRLWISHSFNKSLSAYIIEVSSHGRLLSSETQYGWHQLTLQAHREKFVW